MTLQQQAYALIDELPEDSLQAIVDVMTRMLPDRADRQPAPFATPKMKAYFRMQELRKEAAQYDVSKDNRTAALNEKYGEIGRGSV